LTLPENPSKNGGFAKPPESPKTHRFYRKSTGKIGVF